jgi:4-hydroxybenzoate polyprenyltransferase
MAYLSTKVLAAIKVARPIHWVKNFGIFAAIVFSGWLFQRDRFMIVFWAFWAFNFACSATYILNDIIDQERDRLHPIKKNRPIASGALPVDWAIIELVTVTLISLIFSSFLSNLLFLLIVIYLVIQVFYSLILKNLPVIDIIIIASGFVIRVYAGAFVIDAHLSVWFLLCVISVALFLASGKRRAELGVIGTDGATRKSLAKYKPELLNSYVTMFGSSAWMSWALFTFFESPKAPLSLWLFLADLSKATTINKLMMITIPIVIFGVMRYQSLIFEGRAEAPEKLLLTDKALVSSVILWTTLVVWILYGVTPMLI